ncbi:hypothetical protein [Providencia rettgeri]|uniref:hypothetical protein n=1 Tax=Providencia rettgeri TaxID=587 RepID=UPI000807E5DE|nr:hypothetical protein [Providencia rettgeri]MDL9987979.1 hypothetical protein [Providencia rettgeri]OBY37781.1 hypothetical protein PR729_03045 [Providencia rettgeri]
MDTIYALLIVFVLYCIISDWFMHEYGGKLNSDNFYKFKIDSFFSYQIPALKRLVSLNEENLAKQPIFWIGIILPLIVASWIEYQIILLNPELLSFGNLKYLFERSAPALYVSALIPTLGVLISNIHRTIQTKKQIQVTEVKNISDSFYAHNKYIIEEFKAIEEINPHLKMLIESPNKLYKKIYPISSITLGYNELISGDFISSLNKESLKLMREIENFNNYIVSTNEKINENFTFMFFRQAKVVYSEVLNLMKVCHVKIDEKFEGYFYKEKSELTKLLNVEINASEAYLQNEIIIYSRVAALSGMAKCIIYYIGTFLITINKVFDVIKLENTTGLIKIRNFIKDDLNNSYLRVDKLRVELYQPIGEHRAYQQFNAEHNEY